MTRPALRDDAERERAPSPRATRIALLVIVPLAVVFGVQTISGNGAERATSLIGGR